MTNRSDRIKYCLHPGDVKSITDGQTHRVSARQLADLYGVPMSACTVFRLPKEWDDSDYEWESSRTAGMIHLHPRDDGKYERIDHA
jgi:hypothetical protein